MYDQLVRALTPGGADGVALRNMGIGTGYSQGLTTIEFDETKFREALSNDPNGVRDAFTKVAGNGSSTNGIMLNLHGKLQADAADALAVAITHAHVRATAKRLGVSSQLAWSRK